LVRSTTIFSNSVFDGIEIDNSGFSGNMANC
jgi:hypothetical protein